MADAAPVSHSLREALRLHRTVGLLSLVEDDMDTTKEKSDLKPDSIAWRTLFDERQQKEIKLAELYAKDFAHGTTGHNALIIVARMAELLDQMAK